jgi:PKD repeat protein
MMLRLRLFSLLSALFFFAAQLQAQIFNASPNSATSPALQVRFTACEVYQFDVAAFNALIKSNPNSSQTELHFGNHHWNLQLVPSGLMGADYTLQVLTPKGLEKSKPGVNKTFKGYETNGGGQVRLTVDADFIAGFIMADGGRWYIEPYKYYDPSAAADLFVVYEKNAVIRDNIDGGCIALDEEEKAQEFVPQGDHDDADASKSMACYQADLALAADKSMFNKYGSVAGVENHNLAVLNNVQGDYFGSFVHDIEFNVVAHFIVTGTDPWTSSNDAGTLLGSFRSWGNAGNFGVQFDVAGLWTDRNFNGGTIGIAYLSGVCNNNKYHCLQDFSSNSELLRCLHSHELGHNFSASHDSGGCPGSWIMCPSVSNSNNWSNNSINQINAFIIPRINNGCLAPCGPPPPPLEADFEWSPDPGCQGQPVQFTDLSSGTITGRSWSFPSGSPPSSTQTNPVVTWNTPGTYNVKLTLSGTGGPVSITKPITILANPVANFSYDVDGLTVSFTSTSSNADTYFWEFGDGGESFDENPVYTYFEAGIYTVKLTVTNECGTATRTIIVNTAPTAEFNADPTSGCASLVVQFDNESSANATSYSWQFPGGSPVASNAQNPIVIYQTSGSYDVILTVTNISGSSTIIKPNYINVQTVPFTNFTHSVNGLVVTFTNTTVNGTSYLWNFGDGNTSTQTNPVHTYTSGGTYSVVLTATNACGTTTQTKTVTVAAPPAAGFTATPTNGCAPLTVQFSDQSTGGPTSWNWQFAGGTPSSSTAQNPSVVYNTPGTYSVTLTVSNTAGSNTATQTNLITVNTTPTAGFNNSTNGATVTFTNTSNNATSYLWNFGDNQTSTQTNPSHTYAADGTYTVTLSATNACGTVTFSKTITIVTPPTAGFTATPTSGCASLTVQFTNTSSPNATSWNWQFPGGTPSSSTAQNPTVVYNTPGTYSVTLTASNSAGSNTATQTNLITVNTTPTAGFNFSTNGLTASFTNSSTNATSYSWNFGDGGTSTQTNPSHTYAADGTYTVTLSATNACGTVTTTKTVTIVTPPVAGFSAAPTSGCAPLSVQFTNTSSANATSWNWQFPGGTPSSSTAQNPTVVYNTPGTYSVTLTASNSAGSNTATQTNLVVVNTTPTAGFSSSTNGLTASFTNTSTNATSYSWNFGDGGTSTQTNPSHTYAADGTYTVTLSATNACGTTTFTQNVVIITAPNAGFTANSTTGCAALTVQFQDLSSSNSTTWNWSFPGGTPSSSTQENPLVVYNTPGVYDVSLTVTNSAGTTSTFTQTNFITVLGTPTTSFSSSVNGVTVSFTNTSQNATSYLWDFGDGSTSSEANPTHTYLDGGTYTVTLSATNICGTTTSTQQVTVESAPEAAFTLSSSEGCAPFSVQFTNQSSPNATAYAWTFEGGNPATSSEANPSSSWSQSGTYLVTLVVSNAAGSDTATATVTVNDLPVTSFTAQTAGLSVVLTNNSQNADSYFWEFGDGNTSTEANPTHNYGTTGTFTVVLKATNECGTTESTTQVEISGSAPIAGFEAGETNGCVPFDVTFTDQSAGNPTAWLWTFEGGDPATSTEQNPKVTYSSTGSFPVTLIVTNIYGNDTLTVQNEITAQSVPTSGFAYLVNQNTVTFSNQSLNATTYNWNFGDGNTSSEASPTHTFAAPGTYTVQLTAANVCGASTIQQMVEIKTVGTNEASWLNAFRLYPNPNTGAFTVEMSGLPHEEVEFTLFNAIGQLVKRDVADFGTGLLKRNFDYGQIPAGMYSLRIQAGESVTMVKISVQR